MACLLLAGKTEESPKKLEFVIKECWKLRRRAQLQQQQQASGGGGGQMGNESPNVGGMSPNNNMGSSFSPSSNSTEIKADEYLRLKERVLLLERVILHTIGFELSIDHPFKFLIDCVQSLSKKRLLEYSPAKKEKMIEKVGQSMGKPAQNAQLVQELAQNAMNFANDSLHTTLCLQFTAQQIAMACVYLSGKYSGIGPVGGKSWFELLDGISIEELTSISVQILELVQPKRGVESEQAFKAIRKDLDEMAKEDRDDVGVSGGDDGDGNSNLQPDAKRQKVN